MTAFNPLTGSILQTPQVQRQQAAEKSHQLRRQQATRKNAAGHDDVFEHPVESSDAVKPVNDEQKQDQPRRQSPKQPSDDSRDHVDVKA